jgi:nicotinamidase/pyrazinamidase
MTTTAKVKRALIRVDIQNGFMPLDSAIAGTGELPVDGATQIIPIVNSLSASTIFDIVVDTQDYHPADHGSFYTMHTGAKQYDVVDLFGIQQTLWNPHCRQGTPGCEFYPTLDRKRVARAFPKGTDKTVDSYSGFWDNGKRKSTGLADYLRAEGVTEVYVVGVTRPYCASWTALDAAEEGFTTFLIEDACSLLELAAGAGAADLKKLGEKKVTVIQSADILGKAG